MTVAEEQGTPLAVHGEWLTLLEDLLAGVVHASNNAITALTVLLELTAMDDGEVFDQPLLTREFARLQSLVATTGLLSGRSTRPEALEIRVVLDVAVGIHAHHRHLCDIECIVQQRGVLLPVRVPRSELLRLLLLMIDAAKRARTRGAAVVILSGDSAEITLQVVSNLEPGDELRAFAESCGGGVHQVDGALRFELPSLLTLRQRARTP